MYYFQKYMIMVVDVFGQLFYIISELVHLKNLEPNKVAKAALGAFSP